MIKNPILPGFNPDPCICAKGDDFYIACSTFEWMPGIPIYHSKDLEHWEHISNVITDDSLVDLKKLPSAKGIWAPCLTYCEDEDLFYVVYGVMNSMNARYFDVDNFVITAKDICGPWSEPVYLHSAGFDASMLHDDNGKKWVVSLLWETRDGYEKPGPICICEYDSKSKKVIGYPTPIYNGGTDRGCIEAPHLYKWHNKYYLLCAEGGTGYYHSATLARSDGPFGPYEADKNNPIITSFAGNKDERADTDHLKPHYYAKGVALQKSGHASIVHTKDGTPYAVHLCSRPLMPEKACVLGRESAIELMEWTDDGWLKKADGSNIASEYVKGPDLPEFTPKGDLEFDDFDENTVGLFYLSPRIMPHSFASFNREGYITLRGQESLASANKVSLLCRRLESLNAVAQCKLSFAPEVYRHTAGIALYYDNMNFIYLNKYYSESLNAPSLRITRVDNGDKTDITPHINAVGDDVYMRLTVEGKGVFFEYKFSKDDEYKRIGDVFQTAKFSDEYSNYGEFTGTMVGIACTDEMFKRKSADFDFFSLKNI